MLNLADRIERDRIPAQIVLVAATRPGVPGIDRARERGLPTAVIAAEPRARSAPERAIGSGRRKARAADRVAPTAPAGAVDDALDTALRAVRPDLICLCGYLRLFRVGEWKGRVINLHPGPLPRFGGKGMYGRRVHRAVLDANLPETRCCVHVVDEIYDHGPVLAERKIPVLPADTPESLEQRVRQAERELLPDVVRRIAEGEIPLPLDASAPAKSRLF